MNKALALVLSCSVLAGCSSGGNEITSLGTATAALQNAGITCSNIETRTEGSIAFVQCETDSVEGLITIGFSQDQTKFESSWVAICESRPIQEILISDTWVLALTEDQAVFHDLKTISEKIGGRLSTVDDYCSSLGL